MNAVKKDLNKKKQRTFQNLGSLAALIILCIVIAILTPNFLKSSPQSCVKVSSTMFTPSIA